MIKKHGCKKMDGGFPMTKFKNVNEWFIRDYIKVKDFKSKSMDLDYFLEKNRDPLGFVTKGIEMLDELIVLCEKENILENIMPCLVFPLRCREDDKISIFDQKTFCLADELHELSPGDICLIERDLEKYYVIEESYRCNLNIRWPIPINSNCRAYYKCVLDNDTLEVGRSIHIEHYTDNLLKFCKTNAY